MRNEFIFHTPCSAKQSYFSEYLLRNCSTGKARLELTLCVLSAQLSLMRCLLLIGASSCSGSTLPWLFIFFLLSQSKHWQRPWAISSSSTTQAVLEQLPCTGNLLFISRNVFMSKYFIKVQTQRKRAGHLCSGSDLQLKDFCWTGRLDWISEAAFPQLLFSILNTGLI